jgi:hypothetical protein
MLTTNKFISLLLAIALLIYIFEIVESKLFFIEVKYPLLVSLLGVVENAKFWRNSS